MKTLHGLSALCLIAVAMAAPNQSSLQQVSQAANSFSNRFFKAVTKQENLICSPLSANVVLAMAAYGSKGNTLNQFNEVLLLPQPETFGRSGYRNLIESLNNVEGVDLRIANKVFASEQYPIKDSYKKITADDFHSASQTLNFAQPQQAANIINTWCADQTNNRIKDLIGPDSLGPDTGLVLVNAIYFKGKWKTEFDPRATRPKNFHLTSTNVVQVPTMYKESSFKFGDIPGLNARFIELPYKAEDLKMIIILPNEIDGLADVEKNLDQINYDSLLSNSYPRTVKLFLPKFKIESTLELNDVVANMGLTDIFDPSRANFSGISDVPSYVSQIKQKAFIEVNEEGSEAAAATGLTASLTSAGPPIPILDIDHPFYYAIVKVSNGSKDSSTKITLFDGHVIEPKSQ